MDVSCFCCCSRQLFDPITRPLALPDFHLPPNIYTPPPPRRSLTFCLPILDPCRPFVCRCHLLPLLQPTPFSTIHAAGTYACSLAKKDTPHTWPKGTVRPMLTLHFNSIISVGQRPTVRLAYVAVWQCGRFDCGGLVLKRGAGWKLVIVKPLCCDCCQNNQGWGPFLNVMQGCGHSPVAHAWLSETLLSCMTGVPVVLPDCS